MIRWRGFTLVEGLLSLLILSFVLLMTLKIPIGDWKGQVEGRLFFDSLVAKLNLSQQTAITKGQSQSITFSSNQARVYFPDAVLSLPSGWSIPSSFRFTYLENGRVTGFRTITFFHEEGNQVHLVFQLGSGKFAVKR